jgi:hypothetical protein
VAFCGGESLTQIGCVGDHTSTSSLLFLTLMIYTICKLDHMACSSSSSSSSFWIIKAIGQTNIVQQGSNPSLLLCHVFIDDLHKLPVPSLFHHSFSHIKDTPTHSSNHPSLRSSSHFDRIAFPLLLSSSDRSCFPSSSSCIICLCLILARETCHMTRHKTLWTEWSGSCRSDDALSVLMVHGNGLDE